MLRRVGSSLIYPKVISEAHRINRQIKSCVNLEDLCSLLKNQRQIIHKYGRTLLLEYLNEHTYSRIYRTIPNPRQVLKEVELIKPVNIYEEQLKHTILCKLLEYAPGDLSQAPVLLEQQLERVQQRTRQDSFDRIDALNWLVGHRLPLFKVPLSDHAFQKLDQTVHQFNAALTRLSQALLKRLIQMRWEQARQYTTLLRFYAQEFRVSGEHDKQLILVSQYLLQLGLHRIGYGIPLFVKQAVHKLCLAKCQGHALFSVVEMMSMLPRNCMVLEQQTMISKLYQIASSNEIFLSHLPYQHMNLKQLQSLVTKIKRDKKFRLSELIYYINSVKHRHMLRCQSYRQLIISSVMPRQIKTLHITDLVCVIGLAVTMLDYYHLDKDMTASIRRTLSQREDQVTYIIGHPSTLIGTTSLCSFFNILTIYQAGIFKTATQEMHKLMSVALGRFHNKIGDEIWRSNKHQGQVLQILTKHLDTPFPLVRQYVIKLVDGQIKNNPCLDEGLILGILLGASTPYTELIERLYTHISENREWLNVAESYARSQLQGSKSSQEMLIVVWNKSQSFKATGRLIASVQPSHFLDLEGQLDARIAKLTVLMAQKMNRQDLSYFFGNDLIGISRFCRHYGKYCQQITNQLIQYLLENQASILNRFTTKDQVEILYQLSLSNPLKESSHLLSELRKVLTKIQSSQNLLRLKIITGIFNFDKSDSDNLRREIAQLTIQGVNKNNEQSGEIACLGLTAVSRPQSYVDIFMYDQAQKTLIQSITKHVLSPPQLQSLVEGIPNRQTKGVECLKSAVKHSLDLQIEQTAGHYLTWLEIDLTKSDSLIQEKCIYWLRTVDMEAKDVTRMIRVMKSVPEVATSRFVSKMVEVAGQRYKQLIPWLNDMESLVETAGLKGQKEWRRLKKAMQQHQ